MNLKGPGSCSLDVHGESSQNLRESEGAVKVKVSSTGWSTSEG